MGRFAGRQVSKSILGFDSKVEHPNWGKNWTTFDERLIIWLVSMHAQYVTLLETPTVNRLHLVGSIKRVI